MYRYLALNGHYMEAQATHLDRDGREVWDYWNAAHSRSCHCLQGDEMSGGSILRERLKGALIPHGGFESVSDGFRCHCGQAVYDTDGHLADALLPLVQELAAEIATRQEVTSELDA